MTDGSTWPNWNGSWGRSPAIWQSTEDRSMAFFQSVRRILFFGSGVRRRLYLKMARMLSYLKPDEVLQKLIKAEEKAGFRQNRTLLFYLRRWQRQVENGKSLSEAMRGNVPDIESILVKAAERQNALGSGLEAVVRIMDAVEQIMKAVRKIGRASCRERGGQYV